MVVVTSDPLALIAEKSKASKRKEKVVVSFDSKGSDGDDISELKKITALLAKAFNRKKFYAKPTNKNLRNSSATSSVNKKQECVKSDDKKDETKVDEKKRDMSKVKCYNCKKEGHFAKDCKKAKVKDYEYYKTKMLLAKKEKDKQVLLAEVHAWMESSSDSYQEIIANMVFMAQIEKVLSDSKASSSSSDDKIAEIHESMNVNFDKISEMASKQFSLEPALSNLNEMGKSSNPSVSNVVEASKKDLEDLFQDFYDEYFDSSKIMKSSTTNVKTSINEEVFHEMIKEFDKKIAKYQKRLEKANQQCNDFENQNKDLKDKYDVLKNQATTFEEKNNELNEQIKVLIEKNDDLLAQTNVLKEQLKVKHVVIDTRVCQAKYAKLEVERYEYMIRYSAYFDNDKQHRKQIDDQEILFDKMSYQLVEMNNGVLKLKDNILEKEKKIYELEECVRNNDLEIEKCLERLNDSENKLHKIGQTNQTIHMIIPSKDKMFNGRKGIGFENLSYFCKVKDLRPTLYDERVIGLGYTLRFLTHSNKALEIKNFKRERENKIEFTYDYRNLNASYVNEKINLSDDYYQEIINLDFDKNDSLFQQMSSLKSYVSNVILKKIIIDLEDEVSLLEKEKETLETIESLKLKGFKSSEKEISESENHSEHACQVVKNVCDELENINVIAPGTFKLRYSKHVMGNRALLTNFVEKFLGMVRFGNNDFAVNAGYGDVIIRSMTIKRVYYVEGLGHNLFSVGQFCNKGLEVAFQKSICFVQNENGVDSLTEVKTEFLNAILKEEVYVAQPPGFVSNQYPDHVYALDKALYGLKQAPQAWYDVLSKFLIDSGFQKVLWMRAQLMDYGFFFDKVPIYYDSKSAIAISCNPVQHTQTKHIDMMYHFIKDHVEKGTIELYFVGTEYQLTDLFTKSLPEARFKFLAEKLGMMSGET
uniref:Ribonuclease H n=1 Tax=Tanacetum cinerariifolium TaxID=118510 RepID=A0A6L2MQE7_TANCI|nr:ribonuclease H [Tanacetum cinerariifolium]